jgi:hypothetical protein
MLLGMSSRKQALEDRIGRIKLEIAALDELRPGSLSKQYNVCGRPGCRCKANPPQKHGPYYQLSFSFRGKNTSEFVRREDLPRVREQIRNYKRLRTLLDQWCAASMALAKLRREEKLP